MESTAIQLINFFSLIRKLKTTPRAGWVRKQVKNPESVADHMYRMGMMAFAVRDKGIDFTKCIKMALVHDIAESIVGDITPYDGISPEEKNRMETEAMKEIKEIIGDNTEAAKEIMELWLEYSSGSTKEAKLVKDFDKLELILQAFEYESEQNLNSELQEFFDATKDSFKTRQGLELANEIRKRRRLRLEEIENNSSTEKEEESGIKHDNDNNDNTAIFKS